MAEIKSVCVYCGSSLRVADAYKNAAADFGALLARRNVRLIYGGGQVGMMGIVADAVLSGGGEVVGIIPDFLYEKEIGKSDVTDLVRVGSMHERKQLMAEMSDGFVALPGGFGTLDETFEILTWRQLSLHAKPIVIADIDGYWRPLIGLMDHIIESGFAGPDNRRLYEVVTDIGDILPALAATQEPASPVESKWM